MPCDPLSQNEIERQLGQRHWDECYSKLWALKRDFEKSRQELATQRGPTACPNCGWESGWAGTPPCRMPWGGRAEDHAATYRGCKLGT